MNRPSGAPHERKERGHRRPGPLRTQIRIIQCYGGKRINGTTLTYHVDPGTARSLIMTALEQYRMSTGESAEAFKNRQELRNVTKGGDA